MDNQAAMTGEQSFFAVFCIEALADEMGTTGDMVYKLLTESRSFLKWYEIAGQARNDKLRAACVQILRKHGILASN